VDLPDEGHGLAVPDGRELPHLARAEELQCAQLAQRPPVGPVGSEGEVVAIIADDLRGEQVHRKVGSGIVVGGSHGCWPLCASEDPTWLLGGGGCAHGGSGSEACGGARMDGR
jgi:hypothetical protein